MIEEKTTVEEPEKVPVKLQYKIETSNGEYVIKRPVGRAGILHFTLITKALPTTYDEEGNLMPSPADQDRFTNCFMEWAEKILPEVFVSGPVPSVKEIPGEDAYALFLAMFQVLNLGGGGNLFRFID